MRPATPRRPTRRCASRFATRRWFTPDETGWRVGAVRHWLWAFATPDTTVYAICPGRGFDDAVTVLDADFDGVLVRDGWAPYRRSDGLHQTVMAALA